MIVYPHTRPGDTLLVDGLTHEQEVISRRTSRGKTFDLGGNKFRLRSGIMPVHYHDGKRWQDVDLSVTERNGLVICDTAGYEVKFDRVVPSLVLEGPQGEGEVALDKVGNSTHVDAASYRVEGNEIIWDYGDYSIHAEVRPAAVEFYKLLKTPAAPRKFEWVIGKEKRNVKFNRKSAGRDHGKRNLQMVTSSDGNRYTEEWTGKIGVIADKKTRRKSWAAEAEYPVLVDTLVHVGITADADDGNQNATAWGTDAVFFGKYYANSVHAGFRFQALSIPAGAIIIAAQITIKPTAGTGMIAKLYGDLQADAPAFSASDLPSAIDKTLAKFTIPASFSSAPMLCGVTDMLQSIIDLTGWTAGNDVRFAILNGITASTAKLIFVIDYPSAGYAVLDIHYSTTPLNQISMPRVRIGH